MTSSKYLLFIGILCLLIGVIGTFFNPTAAGTVILVGVFVMICAAFAYQ